MTNCLNPKSLICLDPKSIINTAGYHLLWSRIASVLGLVFAVLGIISDATNATLGLEPISWFLLAISVSVVSIAPCIGWAVAAYLRSMEAKKEQ